MASLRSDPHIVCTARGQTCPELAAAQQKFRKFSSCDEAEGFVGSKNKTFWPQPTCSNWTSLTKPLQTWTACRPQEENFWTAAFVKSPNTNTCVMQAGKGNTSLIIPRRKLDGKTDLCGPGQPSCRRWGPWLPYSPCQRNRQTRHRFCKIRFS